MQRDRKVKCLIIRQETSDVEHANSQPVSSRGRPRRLIPTAQRPKVSPLAHTSRTLDHPLRWIKHPCSCGTTESCNLLSIQLSPYHLFLAFWPRWPPALVPSLDSSPSVLTQTGQYQVSGSGIPCMLTHVTWNLASAKHCDTKSQETTYPFVIALFVVATDHLAVTLLLAETIQRVVGLCLAVPIAHVCLAVRVGIF